MNWGSVFQDAYHAATEKAKQAANLLISTAKGVGNVVGFGARLVVDEAKLVAGALVLSVEAPYLLAKNLLSPSKTPQQTNVQTCRDTWPAKKQRLEERQRLIANGQQPGASPALKAAADRLQRNNEAVELARLSDDTYDQYDNPPINNPPFGWQRISDAVLEKKGIDLNLLQKSQAVIYQTAPDWPGGQQTVLAFRGTAGKEDVETDYNQALSVSTAQYRAAARLGDQVADKFGDNVLVTGHSLGGGKAQAAGTAGGLKGTGFNAAGLNPDTLKGAMPGSNQFLQYRTTYDPVTGAQNSAIAQSAAVAVAGVLATPIGLGLKLGDAVQKALGFTGLSPEWEDYADKAAKAFPRALRNLWEHGDVLPPAVGKIVEVPALDNGGNPVSPLDPEGQHSIKNLVNGIEAQKSEDISTLRGG